MARKDLYEYKKGVKYPVEGNVIKTHEKPKKRVLSNVHQGHRERLRKRFLDEGLDNFQDHNVLEFLLFYSIPMKDTNDEAHALMEEFGSLSAVFDADYEDLCAVKGVGENTAALIKLMPQLFKKYEMDKLNKDGVYLNSSNLSAKYMSSYFKGVTEEKIYVLSLDSTCRLLSVDLLNTGTVNKATVDVRKIVEIAIKHKANNIVLTHNHPSGVTAPSNRDIATTTALIGILADINIRLNDHIIIGCGDEFFSFRNSERWKHIFN